MFFKVLFPKKLRKFADLSYFSQFLNMFAYVFKYMNHGIFKIE